MEHLVLGWCIWNGQQTLQNLRNCLRTLLINFTQSNPFRISCGQSSPSQHTVQCTWNRHCRCAQGGAEHPGRVAGALTCAVFHSRATFPREVRPQQENGMSEMLSLVPHFVLVLLLPLLVQMLVPLCVSFYFLSYFLQPPVSACYSFNFLFCSSHCFSFIWLECDHTLSHSHSQLVLFSSDSLHHRSSKCITEHVPLLMKVNSSLSSSSWF